MDFKRSKSRIRTLIEKMISADVCRQKITSKERDNESGLDYFDARYFSGVQGRFPSIDPAKCNTCQEQPQIWNRYSYALNNPLVYIDLDGYWPFWIHNSIYQSAFKGVPNGRQMEYLMEINWKADFGKRMQKRTEM
jgi:RHS repeat-associated protein